MSKPTLTRADQVLKVLRHGGRIEAAGDRNLLRLVDRKGVEQPAWQTAMKAAQERAAAARGEEVRDG